MDDQEQLESPRRSRRPQSPTKKVLDNVAASHTANQRTLTATSSIPLRTMSSVKLNQSPQNLKQDLRSQRKIDNDDGSENNIFPNLQPITFDSSRETTDRTRSSNFSRERADMRFYNSSIVFSNIESSDHSQEMTNFMMKFKFIIREIIVISEYFKINLKSEKKIFKLFID